MTPRKSDEEKRDQAAKSLIASSKTIFDNKKKFLDLANESTPSGHKEKPSLPEASQLSDELAGLEDVKHKLDILSTVSDQLPSIVVVPPTEKEGQLYQVVQKIIHDLSERNEQGKNKVDQKLFQNLHRRQELQQVLLSMLERVLDRFPFSLTVSEQMSCIKSVIDEIVGCGPIEPLLQDPEISEIMVNGPRKVFVEKKGVVETTEIRFFDDTHLVNVIGRIVGRVGRRIDYTVPYADARLEDGSRVHAIIPPLALDGPMMTIRKFKRDNLQIEDLISFDALSTDISYFLGAGVKARLNIVVAGGTGSGKTTLLNILSTLIPGHQRIITIEDSAELKLAETHPHVVRLESRTSGTEGTGAIPIRELVKQALRMRPDRIIVGECRGGEAMDMLQAMNTGHDGSMTTGHANSAEEILERLTTMCLMSGLELPASAIKRQISSAIDLIIHLKRYPDGSRKISEIIEVTGFKDGEITFQPLFWYEVSGRDNQGKMVGEFKTAAAPPKFIYKFEAEGIDFPKEIFGSK